MCNWASLSLLSLAPPSLHRMFAVWSATSKLNCFLSQPHSLLLVNGRMLKKQGGTLFSSVLVFVSCKKQKDSVLSQWCGGVEAMYQGNFCGGNPEELFLPMGNCSNSGKSSKLPLLCLLYTRVWATSKADWFSTWSPPGASHDYTISSAFMRERGFWHKAPCHLIRSVFQVVKQHMVQNRAGIFL